MLTVIRMMKTVNSLKPRSECSTILCLVWLNFLPIFTQHMVSEPSENDQTTFRFQTSTDECVVGKVSDEAGIQNLSFSEMFKYTYGNNTKLHRTVLLVFLYLFYSI